MYREMSFCLVRMNSIQDARNLSSTQGATRWFSRTLCGNFHTLARSGQPQRLHIVRLLCSLRRILLLLILRILLLLLADLSAMLQERFEVLSCRVSLDLIVEAGRDDPSAHGQVASFDLFQATSCEQARHLVALLFPPNRRQSLVSHRRAVMLWVRFEGAMVKAN